MELLLVVSHTVCLWSAEAGAFPNLSRGLARWFPQESRARASGVLWMGARLGGALAPPLTAILISWLGWRFTFAVFGMVGFVWCVVLLAELSTTIRESILKLTQGSSSTLVLTPRCKIADTVVPWRRLLLSGNLWALFWTYFSFAYGFYFFLTWLPTYLRQEHGLNLERSGVSMLGTSGRRSRRLSMRRFSFRIGSSVYGQS